MYPCGGKRNVSLCHALNELKTREMISDIRLGDRPRNAPSGTVFRIDLRSDPKLSERLLKVKAVTSAVVISEATLEGQA